MTIRNNIIKDRSDQCEKNCRFGILKIALVLMMLMVEMFLMFELQSKCRDSVSLICDVGWPKTSQKSQTSKLLNKRYN